jgi:biopolymer transport protein ExbB/TolQ
MVLLVMAAIASLATWIVAAARAKAPRQTAKASARLALIGRGALMVGLLAGADNLLHICMGIANKRPEATIIMLAPGLAEALLCITLGLLAATIATIARRHLALRDLG